MARSRRLGSVGEVSVWPDPVLHKNQPVSVSETRFFVFFVLRKNLGGRDPARVFATQRSRIRGDWILSTQRLPIHWSLRGYNFFSALRADEKGVCICVYNRN